MQQERISRHQARDPHWPALCVPQMAAGFQVRACSCKQLLRSQHPACWLPLVAMGCSGELKLSVKQPSCWLCQPSLQLCCFQGLVASVQCCKASATCLLVLCQSSDHTGWLGRVACNSRIHSCPGAGASVAPMCGGTLSCRGTQMRGYATSLTSTGRCAALSTARTSEHGTAQKAAASQRLRGSVVSR